MSYPSSGRHQNGIAQAALSPEEEGKRRCFIHFIRGLLQINPIERWTPLQAISHPFITGQPLETVAGASVPRPINARQAPQRPRANTLATLSLQDVPGPLQKLAAAAHGAAAPPGGPTGQRDGDRDGDTDMDANANEKEAIPIILKDDLNMAGSYGTLNNTPVKGQLKRSDNYYANRYVDHRRVSQAALSTNLAGNTKQHPEQTSPGSSQPNSLPTWYAGNGSSSMYNTNQDAHKRSPKRRESIDAGMAIGNAQIPNSPLSGSDNQHTATATARTRRKSTSTLNSPSMDSIGEDG